MGVRTWTAIGLGGVALLGAGMEEIREHPAAGDLGVVISAEAGPLGGTVIYPAAIGGYAVLDVRSPVDPGPRPPYYRGGAISL